MSSRRTLSPKPLVYYRHDEQRALGCGGKVEHEVPFCGGSGDDAPVSVVRRVSATSASEPHSAQPFSAALRLHALRRRRARVGFCLRAARDEQRGAHCCAAPAGVAVRAGGRVRRRGSRAGALPRRVAVRPLRARASGGPPRQAALPDAAGAAAWGPQRGRRAAPRCRGSWPVLGRWAGALARRRGRAAGAARACHSVAAQEGDLRAGVGAPRAVSPSAFRRCRYAATLAPAPGRARAVEAWV